MTADPNQHQQHGDGSDPIVGKVIDGCRIQRKLGQGGMGVVYLAEHEQLRQQFVIKILNPALVGAEDTVERFFREAQACAQLNHPGIVAIQNVGQEGEYYFIRMEYIEGRTLEDTIKERNQFDWKHATQIIIDTGDALSHAHQKGMIHRDIKPENIMLTPQGAVKVMDFGLAKHVHSQAKVSVTGQIVGTPFFMSPEQAGGKPTDARSDIYSLGVTLYYMLTGVKPFNGKNLQEIFLKHFFYAPESPKIYNPELPEALCEIVKKCLKKKKKERYQSAKELTKDLRTVLDDPDARIVADGPGGGEAPADAPEPSPAQGGDFGKTIRARDGGGEGADGNKTLVAQADKTMVSGGLSGTVRVREDVQDGTVRVSEGGDDGATVRVDEGDNEATVNVKDKGGSATVKVGADDDDEHPAAGLDLPTTVIKELGLDAGGVKLGGGAVGVGVDRTKVAIVAGVLLVPLLLVGGNELRAKSKFSGLRDQYEKHTNLPHVEMMKQDPVALSNLANEMRDGPVGISVNRGMYDTMEKQLRDLAAQIDKQRKDEAAKAAADRETAAAKAAALEDMRQRALKFNEELAQAQVWLDQKNYAEYSKWVLEQVKKNGDLPEVQSLTIPVRVGSFPDGAEVYLVNDQNQQVLQANRTPTVVQVRPNADFTLLLRKSGFREVTVVGDASTVVEDIEKDLERGVLTEIVLPTIQVQVGTRTRPEPLTPVSALAIDPSGAAGGVAYFVTHDGRLRAWNLKRRQEEWRAVAGTLAEQQVGMYGDATPSPTVVPGQVVLASSLLGRISAHRPQNDGLRIWTVDVGAEVTSPPAFGSAGGQPLIAAGLSTGEVVFILNGKEDWRFRTENAVVTRPFLQGARAFIGSRDDKLYAVDYANRLLDGSLDLGADVIDGPRAIAATTLVVATEDGLLHLVNTTNPKAMVRLAELGTAAPSAPQQGFEVVADRIFHTTGKELRAYVVQGGQARPLWKEPCTFPVPVTRPVVNGDVIYVGGTNGFVYAIDRADGTKRWSHDLPNASITLPPFVVEQELFVPVGGKLVVLQAD